MTLPSLTKTWRFQVNRFIPNDEGGATDSDDFRNHAKNLLFFLKECLVNGSNTLYDGTTVAGNWTDSTGASASDPTTNWTVPRSAGINAGFGTSDQWGDRDELRNEDNTGNNRSWIVLANTALGIEMLIDCVGFNGSDGAAITFYTAQTAFTGGALNARPTSTDEVLIRNGFTAGTSHTSGWWGAGDSVPGDGRFYTVHVMRSTDGECSRAVIYQNDNPIGFWIFDKPQNPVTGWTNPHVTLIAQYQDSNTESSVTQYSRLHDNNFMRSNHPAGTAMFVYLTSEGFGTNAVGESIIVRNQVDGSFALPEIGLASLTAGVQGRHGKLFDAWYGPTSMRNRTHPSDNNRAFVQMGDLVFPWNQSALKTE